MATQTCTNKMHRYMSDHPKDEVPIELFKSKDPDKMYKNCEDCRNYYRNTPSNKKSQILAKEHREAEKEKHKLSLKNNDSYAYCPGEKHDKLSKYERDKVPKVNFMKYPDNPKSTFYTACSNCRENHAKEEDQRREKNKAIAENDNLFWCQKCNSYLDTAEKSVNLKGENSNSVCKKCKNLEKDKFQDLKSVCKTVKLEFMEKYQSCCYLCNKVFLYNTNNTVLKLDTHLVGDKRYLSVNNEDILVYDFLVKNKNRIAMEILHFDHLTEQEQRERGLLGENEQFVPKKNCVLRLRSEDDIRLEAAKCQVVCGYCHLLETIRREKGKPDNERSLLERKKLKYINSIKSQGCTVCHYKNPNLPRFFHFDHLNPNDKEAKSSIVSFMTMHDRYSFKDVVNEINKCRVLCLFCHVMHTKSQLKEGVLDLSKKKSSLDN